MTSHSHSTKGIQSRATIAAATIASVLEVGGAHQSPPTPSTAHVVAATPDAVATVNGEPIIRMQIDDLVHAGGQPESPARRDQLVRGLIGRKLIRQAAEAEKLDNTSEIRAATEKTWIGIKNRLYIDRHVAPSVVSDDAVYARYDALLASISTASYKPAIILQSDRAARSAFARLERHESFARVAATSSAAPSKSEGGALPRVSLKSLSKSAD